MNPNAQTQISRKSPRAINPAPVSIHVEVLEYLKEHAKPGQLQIQETGDWTYSRPDGFWQDSGCERLSYRKLDSRNEKD